MVDLLPQELQQIQNASSYLATLLRRSDYVEWLWSQSNLRRRYALMELYQDLQTATGLCQDLQEFLRALRRWKQRHFLRIGGRDLLGWADLVETTSQVSDLACVALQVGLDTLLRKPEWWLGEGEWKDLPRLRDELQLVVMGLGKLGGQELNYVSDVDLIFFYAPKQEDPAELHAMLPVLNHLCQWLCRLLAESVDGDRVFQVDLRLRPQGKDGELVPSLAAAADHYLLHGRPWERQMLLKARPVAGDRSLGTSLLREVRPFVFRRFLDFQALDELRAMRDRILVEAVRPHTGWEQFDVKLGIGGIREIEFLVQSFQLVYGGRHPELDEPNTLRCLERLEQLALLPREAVAELEAAYVFLRRVEHWVQLDQNRQTQKLPRSEDARMRLALALGFAGYERDFLEQLRDCCTTVHEHFLGLFASQPKTGQVQQDTAITGQPSDNIDGRWDDLGKVFPAEYLVRLRDCLMHFAPPVHRAVQAVLGRYEFLPKSHAVLVEKILVRVERYFSQARRRPGLITLLSTAEVWLPKLCTGLAQSDLVADLLSHQPSLVEGIATARGELLSSSDWQKSAEGILAGVADYETRLEWIRRLKNERLLQLALADLAGSMGQEELEWMLSDLADFVIQHTYQSVREERGLDPELPVAILALGKLGSREMNYLSDLDLVFVYDSPQADLNGEIPLEVIRLIQRFMRMLSTPLQEGPGYAVDARLRPTGNYGPLVVTRDSWLDYYANRADLWEVQALLRVRAIAGEVNLCRWIEEEALSLCYRERDAASVWSRLCHLRQRMQQERSDEAGGDMDVKLGAGGLADTEFLVQGHQLLFGTLHKELQTGSIRCALQRMQDIFPDLRNSFRELMATFEGFRALEHRLQLLTNLSGSTLTPGQFDAMKAVGLWPPHPVGRLAEDWQTLLLMRRRVREMFRRWCPNS